MISAWPQIKIIIMAPIDFFDHCDVKVIKFNTELHHCTEIHRNTTLWILMRCESVNCNTYTP